MREHKYRAWDKEQKKMWWFDLLWGNTTAHGGGWIGMVESPTEGKYRRSMGCSDNRVQVDPMDKDIMQFTGLKDKNGVEIYEGDIILADSCDPDKYIAEVVWDMDTWGFKRKSRDGKWRIDKYGAGWLVIGNIYENKELLK